MSRYVGKTDFFYYFTFAEGREIAKTVKNEPGKYTLQMLIIIAGGLRKVLEYQEDFFFQAVVNASVAVDTFFFIR